MRASRYFRDDHQYCDHIFVGILVPGKIQPGNILAVWGVTRVGEAEDSVFPRESGLGLNRPALVSGNWTAGNPVSSRSTWQLRVKRV